MNEAVLNDKSFMAWHLHSGTSLFLNSSFDIPSTAPAAETLDATVRRSYATLLGYLAPRAGGDLATVEDALSEALLAAVQQWPAQGIPDKPEAWLLAVARRRLTDEQRRHAVRERFSATMQHALESAEQIAVSSDEFPDERLKLLFVCAHPAIDEAMRTPLMLQTVLGLDAQAIASDFLVAPAAMAQRLVRAKAKIKAAAIPFEVPERCDWDERFCFVLDAIYAAFTRGWQSSPEDETGHDMACEAIRLGDVAVTLVPEEPEALGLLALMLHCHARRSARMDASGRYVPLDEQDPAAWDHPMIDRAEKRLQTAGAMNKPGRFQVEAAIQSAHAQRRVTGRVEWPIVAALYQWLMTFTPALGARIGHAIATAHASSAEQGWMLLESLPKERLADHQPYWAARAHLLAQTDRAIGAKAAFERAIGLCADPALRAYLWERRNTI
jgi:RNA polymerase sigma-70 factor (ECF subfamily)